MLSRVVIINDLSVAKGGATSIALLSARLLRERGIPVTFVTGDAGEGQAELDGLGAETVAIGMAPLLQRGRLHAATSGLYNPEVLRTVRDLIAAKDGPRVVYHLHTWSRILSPAVFHALRPVAARTFFHAHDDFLACPNGLKFNFQTATPCEQQPLSQACLKSHCDKRSYSQKLWRSARQAVRSLVFDYATTASNVLMTHPLMRPPLEQAGFRPQSLHTLRNPALPFTHAPLSPERQKRFFMISRLDPEKGFEDAAAAARLASVRLTIVGDGPGRGLLEAHYPEVKLLGWRSRTEIGAFLAEARAVVMPTRGPEAFGLVAAEAASSGLPLIVSDQANVAQEILDAGFGMSFRAGSVSDLAAAMHRMTDDRLIARMAEQARIFGKSLAHEPDEWCSRLIYRYEEALLRGEDPLGRSPLAKELAA